jgi:hypothetical protein
MGRALPGARPARRMEIRIRALADGARELELEEIDP